TIREKVYGADSRRLAEILVTLGDIAVEQSVPELALQNYTRAAALDSRLPLAARRAAAGDTIDAASVPPLAADELLSIDRATALALRVQLLARAGLAEDARTLASDLRARLKPEQDAALVLAIGTALLATGDKASAAAILGTAAKQLGNEPTRTALH